MLKSKIKNLPDDHPSKPRCFFGLSQLLGSIGNYAEQKQLLTHALTLLGERGDDAQVAQILGALSGVNLVLGLHKEGIQQAEGALETFGRSGDTVGRVRCLHTLAWLLLLDNQPDAAKDTALQPIGFLPERGREYLLCTTHRVLGVIYDSKGEEEKAINHLETALGIASPCSWRGELFSIHYALADLFCTRYSFDDANAHIEQAKSHAVDNAYNLGRATEVQAWIWYRQHRLEEARFETLDAFEIYTKLGAEQDVGNCRKLLRQIEQAMESEFIPGSGGGFYDYDATSPDSR